MKSSSRFDNTFFAMTIASAALSIALGFTTAASNAGLEQAANVVNAKAVTVQVVG